jgi:hypothetical protein
LFVNQGDPAYESCFLVQHTSKSPLVSDANGGFSLAQRVREGPLMTGLKDH